jgi:DNA replicative helicase MCM subunit Mcm2 (Cdc46/Mcm family)
MESLNLENIISEKVKELCAKNSIYEPLLRCIVRVDKAFEKDEFGWQIKDVPDLNGGSLKSLFQNGLIKQSYHSANYNHYRLNVPRDDLTAILDDIEFVRLEPERIKLGAKLQNTQSPIINPELIQKFEKMLADGTDMLDYWGKWINPKIEGMITLKKSLLLCMASHADRWGDRGRIHVLLHGAPGGAKSVLMEWITYQLGAEFVSQRASKVGLTGDASGNEITPGALPRANGGILCIDELDKFCHKDRQGLLDAMEQGKVKIDVGKISAVLNAEVRVIASANRIDDFSPELLDRFDFKYELQPVSGEEEKKMTYSIVDNFFRSKEGYDGISLKNYLMWVAGYEPQILPEIRQKIGTLMCMYLDLDEAMRGSPRKKQTVLRIAYTIAKLHKRNVEVKDFLGAIKILNPNLNGGKMQALEQLAVK